MFLEYEDILFILAKINETDIVKRNYINLRYSPEQLLKRRKSYDSSRNYSIYRANFYQKQVHMIKKVYLISFS